MFDNRIAATINRTTAEMTTAIIRAKAVTRNFTIPYIDLDHDYQQVALANACEFNALSLVLVDLGYIEVRNALNRSWPEGVKYFADALTLSQDIVENDAQLKKDLHEAHLHGMSWKDWHRPHRVNTDAPAHPSAPDQGQAAA